MMEQTSPITPLKMVTQLLLFSLFIKIIKALYGLGHMKQGHINSTAGHSRNLGHESPCQWQTSPPEEGVAAGAAI